MLGSAGVALRSGLAAADGRRDLHERIASAHVHWLAARGWALESVSSMHACNTGCAFDWLVHACAAVCASSGRVHYCGAMCAARGVRGAYTVCMFTDSVLGAAPPARAPPPPALADLAAAHVAPAQHRRTGARQARPPRSARVRAQGEIAAALRLLLWSPARAAAVAVERTRALRALHTTFLRVMRASGPAAGAAFLANTRRTAPRTVHAPLVLAESALGAAALEALALYTHCAWAHFEAARAEAKAAPSSAALHKNASTHLRAHVTPAQFAVALLLAAVDGIESARDGRVLVDALPLARLCCPPRGALDALLGPGARTNMSLHEVMHTLDSLHGAGEIPNDPTLAWRVLLGASPSSAGAAAAAAAWHARARAEAPLEHAAALPAAAHTLFGTEPALFVAVLGARGAPARALATRAPLAADSPLLPLAHIVGPIAAEPARLAIAELRMRECTPDSAAALIGAAAARAGARGANVWSRAPGAP